MTTTPASAANERDRQEFETWARSKGLISESFGMMSMSSHCDTAWEAWQAARAIPQPAAEPVKMTEAESAARARAWTLGRAGMEFASNLCAIPDIEVRGVSYVRRESVMDLTLTWREKYNKAAHIPRPDTAPDRAPSADSAADARDAARWRAFRSRDGFVDLDYTHFRDKFQEEADAVIDAAIAAMPKEAM